VIGLVVVALAIAGGATAFLLASGGSDASSATDGDPIGQECPADFPVKGNVNDEGERIHYEPGWRFYDRTNPERCFATPEDAEDAGFRPSEVR
jgi:hypothetical protein